MIFFLTFLLPLSLFLEKFFPAFFFPFCCHYIVAVNKIICSHFFQRFLSQHFLFALFVCFRNICFARFSPHRFFGHDIRAIIKKCFFALFQRFFSNNSCWYYSCVSGIFVSRVFFSPYFCHDILANIKNVLSHFFPTIFFPTFFLALFVFLEKLFRASFPPILGHAIQVSIKYEFFAHFPTIFFPIFFFALFLCFWKNFYARIFPLIFWS